MKFSISYLIIMEDFYFSDEEILETSNGLRPPAGSPARLVKYSFQLIDDKCFQTEDTVIRKLIVPKVTQIDRILEVKSERVVSKLPVLLKLKGPFFHRRKVIRVEGVIKTRIKSKLRNYN